MAPEKWKIHNPSGKKRVVVTKRLPGKQWLDLLTNAGVRTEVSTSVNILDPETIREAIGSDCDGVIGQLTEEWTEEMFTKLKNAGVKVYSNYAVGFNNVDIEAATRSGIPVGNTPGVLTETTAEMAVALTFAAARRTGESERFLRAGHYHGWLPTLFLGELLSRKTVGIIGAGRIGAAYARMMAEGLKMNIIYYDLYPNADLENYMASYNTFLASQNEPAVTCKRVESVDELLGASDVVSLHTVLDDTTHHLINSDRLGMMKANAILVNTSRGPVVDEAALVEHCRNHPQFKAGIDVFENEPLMSPGFTELDNVVIVPHIASATSWTREGMAILAATNTAAILQGYPVWPHAEITPFLEKNPPNAAPSIVNAKELGLPLFSK